jgi:arabinofuranosyltransferase
LVPFVLLGAAYSLVMAFAMRTFFMDDAYIGFGYVDNLVSGHGLVFNPGERVEGVTNMGWLLLLAPLAWAMDVLVAAKVAVSLLFISVIGLSTALAWRLKGDELGYLVLPVPVLVATHFEFGFFSMVGMETALLSVLLCLIAWLGVQGRQRNLLALLCAWAYLVHPECLLIFPAITALAILKDRGDARRYFVPALVFGFCIALITAIRYGYYGDYLPNTFRAKPGSMEPFSHALLALVRGDHVNFCPPFTGLFAFPFLAYGLWKIYLKNASGAIYSGVIVAIGMAFALYAAPDWSALGRYYAPYVPVTVIVFWFGVSGAHHDLLSPLLGLKRINQLLTCYVLGLIFLGAGGTFLYTQPQYTENYPGYVLTGRNLVAPAKWMADNLPPDSTIATKRIGVLSFYSGHRIFDYTYGLTDREVAQLVSEHHDQFSYPSNPALEQIWKKRMPEFLLEDQSMIEAFMNTAPGDAGEFVIHGVPYSVLRTFPIGFSESWTLCKRKDVILP